MIWTTSSRAVWLDAPPTNRFRKGSPSGIEKGRSKMTDSANNDLRELGKGSAAEPAQAAAQQDPWAAIEMKDDPKAPKGLGPRATPDLRFSMCYFPAVPEAARVMTKFFHGLAQRDLKLMADALHFPFATWEGASQVIVNSPEELLAKAPPSLNMSLDPVRFTDHDGYMKAGF